MADQPTPESPDALKARLAQAIYRVLERHGADSDVLSVIGSMGDTLEDGEVADLLEDWLATGVTIRVAQ